MFLEKVPISVTKTPIKTEMATFAGVDGDGSGLEKT